MEEIVNNKNNNPLLRSGKEGSRANVDYCVTPHPARPTFCNENNAEVRMTFYINAWLDRADPFVSLHNKQTDEVVAHFEKAQLQTCLEQGDFCVAELCSADQRVQQELVKCLLLMHCSQDLHSQLINMSQQCQRRGLTAQVLPFKAMSQASNSSTQSYL